LKINFIEFIQSAFRQRDEKFRQRLSVFLVCLVISIVIWITIKMANVYTTVIPVTVHFTHLPQNKVLTSVTDSIIRLEIKEKGSYLFNLHYLQARKPVSISLRFTPLYQKNDIISATVSPSALINDFERKMGLFGKIQSISPDTIYLTFEPKKSKKLPVTADFDIIYEKHYFGYNGIMFEPDSVTVTGPARLVDPLDSASLGLIRLNNLSENITITRGFDKDTTTRFLNFYPGEVTLTIPVEKFTEAEIEIPVTINNSGDLRIKTFPDKVKIVYTVALKDYPEVEPEMIIAAADFSTVDISREDRVKVQLIQYPTFIHIKKIEPGTVEYIILK
jgi:hypothetical protein